MFSIKEKTGAEKVDQETDSDSWFNLSQNGPINTAIEAMKAAIRFAVAKKIYGVIIFLAVLAITGKRDHSMMASEKLSSQAANDDWGFFGSFMQEAEIKRTQFNAHPVYKTKAVRKLEHKFEIDYGYPVSFKRLFKYVIYNEQDYLVMKKAARGKNKEKLKLELSTVFGQSAGDYCEDYFGGFIMNDKIKKALVKGFRIDSIRDELTKDNDDGKKYFRCVIDPDTIEDYLSE